MSLNGDEDFPIHYAVFTGDINRLTNIATSVNVDNKDIHGNSPLHLSCMLGAYECAEILLKSGASVRNKNINGWTPLDEAITSGDKGLVKLLIKNGDYMSSKIRFPEKDYQAIKKELEQVPGDFEMQIRFRLKNWLPFFSAMLPSNVCHIYKKGTSLRVDLGYMKLIESDVTYLFRGDRLPSDAFISLLHKHNRFEKPFIDPKTFQINKDYVTEQVNKLIGNEVYTEVLDKDSLKLKKMQRGYFYKEDELDKVGNYNATVYLLRGQKLLKTRSEHLRSMGKTWRSCPSWQSYIMAPPGGYRAFNKENECKVKTQDFWAKMSICNTFPIKFIWLIKIFQHIPPFDDLLSELGPNIEDIDPVIGFPVKLELPIKMRLTSCKFEFVEFMFKSTIKRSMFEIPSGYYCESETDSGSEGSGPSVVSYKQKQTAN